MVKLSTNYIIRHADNLKLFHLRQKNDTDKDFLGKITHLQLQYRYIEQVDQIEGCTNVSSLYLQNNLLTSIHNLDSFPNITHLYLQRNKINKIENIETLIHLKKVYLGYNEISVFEGFHNLKQLTEVHIEYQHLPLGESMYFEPRTMCELAGRIELLNVAGNGLLSITPFTNFTKLRELFIEDNNVKDIESMLSTLSTLPNLIRLNVVGNPVASLREFRDAAIVAAKHLKHIDEKDVKAGTRSFVQGWVKARLSRDKAKEKKPEPEKPIPNPKKIVHFTEFFTSGAPIETDSDEEAAPQMYPPWKLRSTMNIGEGVYIPRPYRSIKSRSGTSNDDF